MMILRVIVAVVGMFIILAGAAALVLPHSWMLGTAQGLVASRALVITAVVEIVLGLVFIAAVVTGQVSLAIYVLVFGLYMLGGGILMLVYPAQFRGVMDVLFLKQTPEGQAAILWVTGLLRILIGVGLVYAAEMVTVRRVVEPTPNAS